MLPAKRADDSYTFTTGANLTDAEPKHSFNGLPNFPKDCHQLFKIKALCLAAK